MKKSLFFKSGISLLILAGIGAASASEASFEGGMYNESISRSQSVQTSDKSTSERGAQGPVREDTFMLIP